MNLAPLLFQRAITLALIFILSCCPAVASSDNNTAPEAPNISSATIGFDGVYKLGCWTPLAVELSGAVQAWTGHVRVTAPDTDGVPTHVSTTATVAPGETTTVNLLVRVGQKSCPIEVALLTEDHRSSIHEVLARRTFAIGNSLQQSPPGGVPSTNRILLEVGASLQLEELLSSGQLDQPHLATRVARIEGCSSLPTNWAGYQSIDTVLLTTSQPAICDALREDPVRTEALYRWVERGGRLFLFCAENAEQLLTPGNALEKFSPGRYEKMERLTQPQPLEIFSGSEQAITRHRRLNLRVPSLIEVRGRILASAGRSETSVPLVVRTRHGFGEIVFIGLDFDSKPLSEWPGRTSFFKRLFGWRDRDANQQSNEQQDTDDVISHLRNSLDKQFVGISVVPFALVAFLAGAYVLLIGPGDYFFVSRLLKRPALTWLTFPLIVAGVSALAYGIASNMKGDQLQVNQVEIVDIDCTTAGPRKPARSTVYSHFFTPEVDRLNLRLQCNYQGKPVTGEVESLVAWLGLPGYALGAMQANGSQTAVFETGYAIGEDRDTLHNLPVQTWSTKTLSARWFTKLDPQVEIELWQDGEELVIGSIANNSAVELTDCALLYGRWAYNLGTIPPQRTISIDDSRQPRTVKTLLTNATAGDQTVKRTSADGTVPFAIARWDVARLVKAMMFFRAVNGPQYTQLAQRYQPQVDLSKVLQDESHAVFITQVDQPASRWLNDGTPMQSDKDQHWTYYRFVAKVGETKQ